MRYNFDTPINRYHTNSLKFDFKKAYGQPEDVLPMWVADMDFPVLPEVTKAIIRRANHPVYGYTMALEEYYKSVMEWMETRHSYHTKRDWFIITPSVVFSLGVAIRAFTKENGAVMINTPVYGQFFKIIVNNDRRIVESPLVYQEDTKRYELNFHDIETKIVKEQIKLYILCSPHNPVGRVWTKEELLTLGSILKKHQVVLVSDEIHMDFVFKKYRHNVFSTLKEEFEEFTITCTSSSKTFNLAGLQNANTIIANKTLRREFLRELKKSGYNEPNIFGMVACQAAYECGADYMDQLVDYLWQNVEFTKEYVSQYMPKLKITPMEGTYLMWLDFREYGFSSEEINHRLMYQAKVWIQEGKQFGEKEDGFYRMNIAVPRSILKQCLEQLREAFS